MTADAEPRTFLILTSYEPESKRVASLISTADESVVLSTERVERCTSSFPSFSHSIVGKGLAMIPMLNFTDDPALYCTTSRYSGGRSMAGAPSENADNL